LADFNDFNNVNASPFARFILQIVFGSSTAVRRSASPITYVAPGAPPFLILYGTEDSMIGPLQSVKLAQGLRVADVPTTLIEVQGTGHTLDTPDQQPSPEELTAMVIDFFATNLK
jgi:dipeptidyl aminopeptidase/acylaminoacyl peptidase